MADVGRTSPTARLWHGTNGLLVPEPVDALIVPVQPVPQNCVGVFTETRSPGRRRPLAVDSDRRCEVAARSRHGMIQRLDHLRGQRGPGDDLIGRAASGFGVTSPFWITAFAAGEHQTFAELEPHDLL